MISTHITGIHEQIDNNKNGLGMKPQDPEELKQAIIRLASYSTSTILNGSKKEI